MNSQRLLKLVAVIVFISIESLASTTYEVGISSSSSLSAPSPWILQTSVDLSKSISSSKTYQVGLWLDALSTATTTSFRVLFAPTIHPWEVPLEDSFFFRPLVGIARMTQGSLTWIGISTGVIIGKRIDLGRHITYKPMIEFSRDATDTASIKVEPLSFSVFLN